VGTECCSRGYVVGIDNEGEERESEDKGKEDEECGGNDVFENEGCGVNERLRVEVDLSEVERVNGNEDEGEGLMDNEGIRDGDDE
jgi:hypothetical protein